ncbi:MAG: GxxExxY protein [Candidatus Omnitrophica bacterium]|nr:GxxExxY protein [Candidatus Omnitrophota bacterium]
MAKLLYEELSYEIRGAAYAVKKKYGLGHKEVLYQRAYAEELGNRTIAYKQEVRIKVYSPDSGKVLCYYQPDFVVGEKIIVELKAKEILLKSDKDRMYSYLRNSKYELGFFINF